MRIKKSHETGSLMVEVIAVIALLGVMGTMMFRQIQRRNEELDNINMASEIRMIKEATAAYIQANKARLEANNCPEVNSDAVDVTDLTSSAGDIEKFMPDNWISDPPEAKNGIIHEYKIYLSCYRINSASADNRLAMYGTIVPNAPDSADPSPLPPNFSLRRAARVATLIGSDGGIYEDGEFVGTMGAWQIPCDGDGTCTDRDDNFYVATTGMDIYIPEVEQAADNTVAVPHDIAFENLHTTGYFSVGDGSTNCVGNYDTANNKFAHETLPESAGIVRQAVSDQILHTGVDSCDPLFWVGTAAGGSGDRSVGGHVYVKQNLYVGRNNTFNRQGVAIESGSHDYDNAIYVYDASGRNTVTLNGTGEVILSKWVPATINGVNRVIQIPALRLKDGRMETDVTAQYYDDTTKAWKTGVYAVDPAGESLMSDIRLTSRGGAKLSDILPDYILKGTQTITRTSNAAETINKPTCPHGYAAAIMVTPIKYSQYVKGVDLELNLKTPTATTTAHNHTITGNINSNGYAINGNENGNSLTANGKDTNVSGTTLTLTQLAPVNITITEGSGTPQNWNVSLSYGSDSATTADPITALAQTYCVFADTTNRTIQHTATSGDVYEPEAGLRIEGKTADQAGTISAGRVATPRACSDSNPCANTEKCVSNQCQNIGTCTLSDGTAISGEENTYCVGGLKVFLECFDSSTCSSGKTCINNRCATLGGS